ncbi:MAG: PQQ-binding-like beta-propeller repeat protein [Saprospiraceae bacterium]|nr:PQQ-binding-like beta-propeller repeat protein [Saprospiraceae bacterium]
MKYEVVDQPLQNRSHSKLIINCRNNMDITKLNFLSREDYQLNGSIDIGEEVFLASINGGEIILYHFNKPGFYKVEIDSKKMLFVQKDDVPEYKWKSGVTLFLDRVNRNYICKVKGKDEVFSFEPNFPISYRWFDCGILFYQNNEKENSWIKCLNPDGGSEKWKKQFAWQFARLEAYDNLIVLEYHAYDKIRTDEGYEGERDWYDPNKYTIVLDGDTGEEIWQYPNGYHQIDYEKGIVLIGNINSRLSSGKIESLSVVELKINDGNVLSEVVVRPAIERVTNFHFVDESGIYYTSHDGSFGKISKTDGTILWEFDLIDDKGEKRELTDWLLLGNGNLVLQAMPNHPNGDLTCVFNPEENMEYSRVKNGIRITTDYA